MIGRLLVSIFSAFLAVTTLRAQQLPNERIFDSAWKAVEDNFYDPSFLGRDWKAIGQRYRTEVPHARTARDLASIISRMLKELPVSHLQIGAPVEGRTFLPAIRTAELDGDIVITNIRVASDAQYNGLRVGDRVITPVAELRGRLGSVVGVRVRTCDNTTRTVAVHREEAFWPPDRPSLRWHQIRQDETRSIGYIQAVRFDDDAAPLIDRAMKDLQQTSGLIIDVRGNSGGNLSSIRLASYFTKPRFVAALLGRPYLTRVGAVPAEIDPETLPRVQGAYTTSAILSAMQKNGGVAFYSESVPIYQGKVVVLADNQTGSAGEGFAWLMREMTTASLVGRQTHGSILGGETFALEGRWTITIPTHAGWGPQATELRDQPIVPEHRVTWTWEDYCRGRDPDVNKALELLRSARK